MTDSDKQVKMKCTKCKYTCDNAQPYLEGADCWEFGCDGRLYSGTVHPDNRPVSHGVLKALHNDS